MKQHLTGYIGAIDRRTNDSLTFVAINDDQAAKYVNVPSAISEKLANLGPGPEADQFWLDQIKGKYSETRIEYEEFALMQFRAHLLGLGFGPTN
jgi:hypothetical protein